MQKNTLNRRDILIALTLIVIGALMRLLPHPSNVTPVAAIALFAGAVLPVGMVLWVPLLVMMLADVWLGLHSTFLLTWVCYFFNAFLGYKMLRDFSALKMVSASLLGSVFFFIVTNLGVFIFDNMYERSAAGFLQCYVMAIPFFRNEFIGSLFYSAVFFTLFSLSRQSATAKS